MFDQIERHIPLQEHAERARRHPIRRRLRVVDVQPQRGPGTPEILRAQPRQRRSRSPSAKLLDREIAGAAERHQRSALVHELFQRRDAFIADPRAILWRISVPSTEFPASASASSRGTRRATAPAATTTGSRGSRNARARDHRRAVIRNHNDVIFIDQIARLDIFVHQRRRRKFEILHQPPRPSLIDIPSRISLPQPDPQFLHVVRGPRLRRGIQRHKRNTRLLRDRRHPCALANNKIADPQSRLRLIHTRHRRTGCQQHVHRLKPVVQPPVDHVSRAPLANFPGRLHRTRQLLQIGHIDRLIQRIRRARP